MKTSQGTLFVVDDDPKSRKAMAALASSMKIRCEHLFLPKNSSIAMTLR